MIKFLKNYKISILLMTIFLSIYGLFSILNITREAQPSVNIPNYIISVIYPGADPETINDQAISKLEQKFKSISMVKKVNSTSANNIGIIMLEFSEKKSDVDATTDIKSAIDQVYPSMPSDVKYPTTKKVDVDDQAIYSFAVAGPYSPEILYNKLKILEDEIKSVAGVSDVNVIGKPVQEIKVNIDFNKLGQLDMDIGYVIGQLKGFFIKYPADKKEINGKLYSFEITNYEKDLEQIAQSLSNYELINKNGKTIKLNDIANVNLGYKPYDNKSFVITDLAKNDTINAISFAIKKVPGGDIMKITENIKNVIDKFGKKHTDLQIVETVSQQEQIQKIFDLFFENFFETGILVFLIILIFLGFKSSIVISIGFFVVYLFNFVFFKAIDYSFNNIVSFSLILVLGIMVDNLIVITQGIVVGLEEHKGSIWDAIGFSLKNYGKAVTFGTLTTVMIFVPLYLGLTGIIGEFLKYLPITIISNLLISLVVTMIILPILFIYLQGNSNKQTHLNSSLRYLEKIGVKFADWYYKLNKNKKSTWLVILFFWGLLILSFVLVSVGLIKVDFFGNADSNNVWINIKYEPGIALQDNQNYTNKISQEINTYLDKNYKDIIRNVVVDLGSERSSNSLSSAIQGNGGGSYNLSSFTIRLIDDTQRPREIKSFEIVEELNNTVLKKIKSENKFVQDIYALTQKNGPGGGKAVGFYIVGENYKEISTYIDSIMPKIQQIPGIYNVTTSIEYTNGKVKYIIDDNKLKQYNISNTSAAMTLIGLQNSPYQPNGIKIKDFNEFGDDTISVNAFLNYSGSIDDLKIGNIYLDQIIKEKKFGSELLSIEKTDGELAIQISADKKDGASLSEIIKEIETVIDQNPMENGLKYKAAGDIESQSQSSSELGTAIIVGIALMFLVLIIQFNNVKYAIVIITSILLTISGALLILGIFGLSFNFVAQLGIFGVFGVGVNQALIHIEDFKDFYEKEGMSVRDSFRKSIALRFIPIFLTKAVTITGLIILALKDEFFQSLATSFIGGLIVSFFVTLLYIPSLMNLISKEHYQKKEE